MSSGSAWQLPTYQFSLVCMADSFSHQAYPGASNAAWMACRALQISDVPGERVPGMTGIWVKGQKIAAIGVRAKSWVTYHGLALNVCMDLQPFKAITPCGLAGRNPTSIELVGNPAGMPADSLLPEYAAALLEAFSDVFGVQLSPAEGSELARATPRQKLPV